MVFKELAEPNSKNELIELLYNQLVNRYVDERERDKNIETILNENYNSADYNDDTRSIDDVYDDSETISMPNKKSAFLRFGKSPAYLRFGRGQAFLRFGKRAHKPYLRFGR